MSPKGLARLAMYFALGVAIVFISLQLSFTFYFNDRIKTELQDEIKKQSDNEYELKIEKLGTNIFNQSIFIKGFTLKPVRTVKSNETKYYASAEEINLIDFRLFSFLIKKDLIVARMELLHPSGNVYRSISQYSDQNEKRQKKMGCPFLFLPFAF